jgi:acetyltransferase-like isoleucine patch superfamily enzyme
MKERKFKKIGIENQIFDLAQIIKPEVIEIGDYCKIDDFTFIYGGEGITIGNHVHMGSFSSVIGGGRLTIGDNAGISQGVRIVTGTNEYKLRKRCSAASKVEEQGFYHGHVQIKNDVVIFSNSVVMPDMIIGEGAVIGALSFVNKNIEPWSVNVGTPCRKIGVRPRLMENLE